MLDVGCARSAEFECEVRKNQSGERKSGRSFITFHAKRAVIVPTIFESSICGTKNNQRQPYFSGFLCLGCCTSKSLRSASSALFSCQQLRYISSWREVIRNDAHICIHLHLYIWHISPNTQTPKTCATCFDRRIFFRPSLFRFPLLIYRTSHSNSALSNTQHPTPFCIPRHDFFSNTKLHLFVVHRGFNF
jgi:hypothetical protein